MYPERMERVVILAPSDHLKRTVELLYKHGVLHIIDHHRERIDIGSPLPESAQLSDLLVKARTLIHSLNVPESEPQPITGDLERVNTVHDAVTGLLGKQKHLDEQLQQMRAERAAYADLAWLRIDPVKLRNSKHLSYFFGTLKDPLALNDALRGITHDFYLEQQHEGNGFLVLVSAEKAAEIKQLLDTRGFMPADHQRIIALNKPLDSRIAEIDKEVNNIRKELAAIRLQLGKIRDEHGKYLRSAEHLLAAETKKAQVPLRFGVTKNTVLINGWVPTSSYNRLQADLEKELSKQVHMQKIETHEEGPIKLENSFVVKPFEKLLDLYTLPKYHEIDPSTFLFLSFPIFFGFMLGDIGYGLVLMIIFMTMRAMSKPGTMTRALSSILIMSAVSSVIFGILFGEFFGLEEIGGRELPALIHRTHDMTTLLGVAIAIGVIHITIALIIGFINELHHHGMWKAFAAKISWILLLAAAGLVGAGYMFHVPTAIAGYALGVVSIVLIYLGEGIKGLVELPGIFSNILSYARLMALGVASAALAVVINEMAGGLFATGGIIAIIGAILILVIGHAINLILGIIGPFLHSLRLHYVEFFSKFYEGGGKPYKPFGVDEQ